MLFISSEWYTGRILVHRFKLIVQIISLDKGLEFSTRIQMWKFQHSECVVAPPAATKEPDSEA